jgi:hypothetical protein
MSFTSLALIKVSFLLFYKAIFVYDRWRFLDVRNAIINSMIFIVVIWDLGFTLTFLSARRSNFRAHWVTVMAKEITVKCINTFLMMYALSISSSTQDSEVIGRQLSQFLGTDVSYGAILDPLHAHNLDTGMSRLNRGVGSISAVVDHQEANAVRSFCDHAAIFRYPTIKGPQNLCFRQLNSPALSKSLPLLTINLHQSLLISYRSRPRNMTLHVTRKGMTYRYIVDSGF